MTRALNILLLALGFIGINGLPALSQRNYAFNSVLNSGNWYKIAVDSPGIYRLDLPFLQNLGINTSQLSSASIRLFGNGGEMLPENCNGFKIDDLQENAIWVEDGADGVLDGLDYLLFYASGPHSWIKDSASKAFHHQKNLFSEKSFYYLTIGGATGKRIQTMPRAFNPITTITSFSDRYFYELDTVNFLASGKQWFGEEFSNSPGKTITRTFPVSVPNIDGSQGIVFRAVCLGRTFGATSRFSIHVNNQPIAQLDIPSVATGPYDQFVRIEQVTGNFTTTASELAIGFDYTPGSFNSQGWLDWFEIFARRALSLKGLNQLLFRDWNSVSIGNTGRFIIDQANASTRVWDITNSLEPVNMDGDFINNQFQFVNACQSLHEYVGFNNSGFLIPVALGKINNQNLHQIGPADFLVIANPALLTQAQRLAKFHEEKDHLNTVVVTTEQVFNEFSSGAPDPSAIRDFAKMYYDKAGTDSSLRPKYLLLFGDGSFDYKSRISNNSNLVPAYESNISVDPLSTYTSDDFFGFLDDQDDINGPVTNLLDIGIGRIPAGNPNEAKAIVDKILSYTSPKSLGSWRNELTYVADDEDANLHLEDAELISNSASIVNPAFNRNKIYLDAFSQQSTSAGSRYPQVNLAINNKIFNGTLIWNYNGHGGYRRLAEEVVLDQDIINSFNNHDKLPLFITATCDFAPFDNPLVSSIGENLLLREKNGAIALMTTTRLVFAFSNRVMNKNYLDVALQKKPDGSYLSLGEAVKKAKNVTYQFFGDVINNRKFTLIGDPALTLAYPVFDVKTTVVNGVNISTIPDTLKALSSYNIQGIISDHTGNILSDYNGTIYPTIFDKAQQMTTLGNDPDSRKTTFAEQKNIIFKGKARVTNGQFNFSFVVPRDINYQLGNGRISYYTENGRSDGNGVFTNILVGGSGDTTADKEGPEIKVFLNDEKFISGSIANQNPILLVKLSDSSGINIMGTGIGHDLLAILDNDPEKKFILNEFYESELDDHKKGIVRFQLPAIEEGFHTIMVKAWDVANNSSEQSLEFRVKNDHDLLLEHVFNYPNPFTTHTTFWFEHNHPGEELFVDIQIYTISGKLVKTLRKTIITSGNRSNDVEWDGKDEYGSKIGRGVYVYRLSVKTADGKAAQQLEKLYLL